MMIKNSYALHHSSVLVNDVKGPLAIHRIVLVMLVRNEYTHPMHWAIASRRANVIGELLKLVQATISMSLI